MRRFSRLALLALPVLLVQSAGVAVDEAAPDALQARVSIRALGAPLRQVLEKVQVDGVRLAPGEEFLETKASIVVRDEPVGEVMRRLAQVFGGEWRRVEDSAPTRYELRRRREVTAWLREWKDARREAERLARKFQEDTIRDIAESKLAMLDGLPDDIDRAKVPLDIGEIRLARFVKTLSPQQRAGVYRHLAAIFPVRSGGGNTPAPPGLLLRFNDLTREQQQLLRDWITGGPGRPASTPLKQRRLRELPNSLVEVGNRGGVAVEVHVHPPAPDHPYGNFAVGARWSAHKVERVLHEELMRRLAAREMPEGALLGASLTKDAAAEPKVRFEVRELADRKLSGLPENALVPEFLGALADASGLNVIADHHTRSARLPIAKREHPLGALLESAARRYESVFRQQGEYLLARRVLWPDRDEEETPHPWPERWIAQKSAGEGLTLDDFLVINRLTEPQLAGLAAYREGPYGFFGSEVRLARKRQWIWAFLAALPEQQRRQAEKLPGLPVRSLGVANRTFLIRNIGQPLDWDRLHILAGGSSYGPDRRQKTFKAYLAVPGANMPVWASENLP
jgi:hypothetical protein